MTTRERRNGGRRRSVLFSSDPDYSNPMDSLLNLSDVMLVLAVGIMLALILRWNVPLDQNTAGNGSGSGAVSLDGEDLSSVEQIPEGSKRVGNVYYDEKTRSYYILEE